MKEEVSHKGRVVRTGPGTVVVAIEQQDACSQCHAAGLCTLSSAVKKEIEVPTRAVYAEGDTVEVVLSSSMGMKAVFLAYFLPLMVLLAVVLGLLETGVTELPAALSGIAATALYYFVLWLFRKSLRKEYIFTIKD